MVRRRLTVLAVALGLALAAPASARVVLLRPGPEGEDVSPYSFLPSSRRPNNETQWAFHATDSASGFDHAMETYLKFAIPPDLLLPGEVVSQAVFWVYYVPLPVPPIAGGGGSNDPGELGCHEVSEPWSEATLTWNNKPDYVPDAFDGFDSVTNFGLIWCNVTELVTDWASGARPNNGIALTNTTDRLISFYSFEAQAPIEPEFRPSLAIEITGGAQPDFDGDGVDDLFDNCLALANTDQSDTDLDGFGNRCDADFNDDGVVGANDVAAIAARFGLPATGNEDFDLDSSGAVGANDIARAANSFGQPPGPSGLACAGTPPCP
jgi:hypothetical protein